VPPLGRGARLALLVVLVLAANEGLRLFLRLDVLERLYALGFAVLLWAFINGRFLFAYYHALRAAWLTRRLPQAAPYTSEDRLLVLAPHPDDETLAAAGQILAARAAGAAVKVVWLTLGDGFELAAPRPGPEGLRALAKIRMEEAKEATQVLGLGDEDRVFLGYPDQGLLRLFLTHYYLPYESPHTRLRRVGYPGCFRMGAPYTCPGKSGRFRRTSRRSSRPSAPTLPSSGGSAASCSPSCGRTSSKARFRSRRGFCPRRWRGRTSGRGQTPGGARVA